MVSISHQPRGFYAIFSPRPLAPNKGVKLKSVVPFQHNQRTDRVVKLKHRSRLSDGGANLSARSKAFKISSFKSSAQNDKSDGGSKCSKKSIQLSDPAHGREETIAGSSDIQNIPLSYTSEEREETIGASPAIQSLFKKWLVMLRTGTSSQTENGIFVESPATSEISESQHGSVRGERKLLKVVLGFFLGLDAAIKFPLLIFIPWYLAINVTYGAQVSRELTPLWVFGPLIVALYIKLIQGLCALYVFTFKQTVKLAKNLPTYFMLSYNYIAEGKLRENVRAIFWQPVENILNLDYKELARKRLKELEESAVEKYLDYVESIWPYYCRMIRFLKKANLI